MADHLIGKFWGLSGALMTALLTLALIAPAGAEAAGPGSSALSQLAALVPAPAQSAVSAALSQVPSASGAAASAVAVPESPPPVHVVVPPPPSVPAVARPTPPPAPANPASAAPLPVPVPAGIASLAVSVPAQSVPQPDAAVQAAVTERIRRARPGPTRRSAGGRRPIGSPTDGLTATRAPRGRCRRRRHDGLRSLAPPRLAPGRRYRCSRRAGAARSQPRRLVARTRAANPGAHVTSRRRDPVRASR